MSLDKKSKQILEKHKEAFDMLKEYDETRTLPFERKRIDLTLSIKTLNHLKKLSKLRKKSISKLIEEYIQKNP